MLIRLEYVMIRFLQNMDTEKSALKKHKFVMIYRIEGVQVIVDGMFHELQDYEGIFVNEFHLNENNEDK